MRFEFFPTVAAPEPTTGRAWVYILQSLDGSLYIGQTANVAERLRKHRLGLGSKHTHDHPGARLVWVEGPMAPKEAILRKAQLKRWSRAKKEALIAGDTTTLRRLSRSHA